MNYGVLGFEMDSTEDADFPIQSVIALRVPDRGEPERFMLAEDDRVDLGTSQEYDGERIGYAYRVPNAGGQGVEVFAVYYDDDDGVWWAVEQGELDATQIYE